MDKPQTKPNEVLPMKTLDLDGLIPATLTPMSDDFGVECRMISEWMSMRCANISAG